MSEYPSSAVLAEHLETEDFWRVLYGDGDKAKHEHYERLAADLFSTIDEDEDPYLDPEEF